MAIALDHLFICTSAGAPEADALIAFGLTEGTSNEHPGQGTANRRFFFRNFMVELLWVTNPDEAQSEAIRPTYLWERWQGRASGSCPFGLCLRSEGQTDAHLPFSTWSYRPPYLPPHLSIAVGANAEVITEPMLFYIPFGGRPDTYPPDRAQPLTHAIGFSEVTRVEFVMPDSEQISPELRALADTTLIHLRSGNASYVELGFDGEFRGERADFRPSLPLTVCW